MPAVFTRKILSEKGLINLPKEFRDFYGLKKGDFIKIYVNGAAIVIPDHEQNGRERRVRILLAEIEATIKRVLEAEEL